MNRWDSEGPFKPLHVMNPTRLTFIRTRPVAIPTQNSFLVVCFVSNMASKLVRHSHLRALSSSISINNHIRSPHFSNPNLNRAPLSYRLFSNASSSSFTGGFQRASSLKDLELAKFASITEICYRLFSNASSSSSTGGVQRASSLKDLELAKFASIA
ncbi:ubiquinone biosynthesis o-methyltransferase [Quercus suber]|uniref:Ubiquinone biosynthesis o-methyltransferase n=1 Tax=Quercus suber TaxID=58331 RepID=A0AAW0M237_QUESU